MLVSTKGRYALRVLADLAQHQTDGYIPLKEIAEREGISEKYLESIIKTLVKSGVLSGLRGKGGGYRLTRSPEQYTVHEILMRTEGDLAPVSCLDDNEPCPHGPNCPTMAMWRNLDTLINDFFSGITLADLVPAAQRGGDYVI